MENNQLIDFVKKRGLSQAELAAACGIGVSALRRRLRGETEFTLEEMQLLTEKFNLEKTDVRSLFFGD